MNFIENSTNKSRIIVAKVSISILVFMLNPVIGILVAALFSLDEKNNAVIEIYIALIAIFLGFVNSTKIPQSDLQTYLNQFTVAQSAGFRSYLALFGKEPVFYALVYVFSHTFGVSFSAFVFCVTLLSYVFYLNSVFIVMKNIRQGSNQIVLAITLAASFFELFSLSAHLIRQILAGSILMYFIAERMFNSKNKWYLLIIAVFIHSTVLFFIPLIFLRIFDKRIRPLFMAVLLGVGWVALSLVPFIGKVILTYIGTGSIGYVLERASASVFLDGTQPAGILVVVNAILLIISLDRIYLSRIHDSRVIHFSYILLVLCLFNLATVNQVLLSYRFSFYCYFFLPIYAVMVIDERFFGKFYFPVIYALLLIMVVRFFYKYEFGTFAYEPIAKLLFQPLIGYII